MPAERPANTAAASVLSLCPRQVLLRHHSTMAKTKSSDGSKTVVEEASGLLLRRSVAAYLEKLGFSDTLLVFLSEAKVKVHDFKTHSLDLELIFDKHLKSSEYPSDIMNPKSSKQDLETIIMSESEKGCGTKKKQKKNNLENVETNFVNDKAKDGHEVEKLHENPGNKKKKKSKECVEISGDDAQQVNLQTTHESECDKFDAKSRDKMKKKELKTDVKVAFDKKQGGGTSKSDTQTIEVDGGHLLNEKDGQQKDKEKKKHKLQTVDDVLKPGKEGLLVDKENTAEPKLEKTQFKSKDKKKQKQKTVTDADKFDDSGPTDGDRTNGSGGGLDEIARKSKDKKKKKHKLLHDSDQNVGNGNGIDIERKESKKRKRLAIENGLHPVGDDIELNDVHVNKKETFDGKKEMELVSNDKDNMTCVDLNPSKKMRTENSEEGLVTTNGTASDLKSKVQLPGDDEAVIAAASASKSEKNGLPQKSSKKDRNGSAEPITVNAFCRVKVDSVTFADEKLQDNSYWAKGGSDTGYGAKAQEILGQVRGRDFRHEKTKKKRGSYRGGQIDFHSHSVKFNYSDEE